VTIKVADYSFNRENTTYDIIVSNDAFQTLGQNVMGIAPGVWQLKTGKYFFLCFFL
jgi:hypothetical protein